MNDSQQTPRLANMDDGGLHKFVAALREVLPDIKVRTAQVIGRVDAAGSDGSVCSSAAELRAGDKIWHVPWPTPATVVSDSEIQAPLFLWGERFFALPTMRLAIRERPTGKSSKSEYYPLDDWLFSAFCEWAYPLVRNPNESEDALKKRYHKRVRDSNPFTVKQHIALNREKLTPIDILQIVGNVVRFALHGRKRSFADRHIGVGSRIGLKIPYRRSPWLRQVLDGAADPENPSLGFRLRSERSVLLCNEVYRPEKWTNAEAVVEEIRRGAGVPRTLERRRLDCAVGIDPYHTPESDGIRTRMHIAVGARFQSDRQLLKSSANEFSLSPSTSQVPFAGYDDPRRLLLAAKAQDQAVPLVHCEAPLVTTTHRSSAIGDPPGVNLRVGYVAWAGWNHEDAWVVSRSAADKLAHKECWAQNTYISALENAPEICCHPGQSVNAGDRLLERSVSPAFLWPSANEARAYLDGNSDDYHNCVLNSGGGEARHDGTVIRIEIIDLVREEYRDCRIASAGDAHDAASAWRYDRVADDVRAKYRAVVRIYFERSRPLKVGDKLANRHGHKGIVGLILPDNQMPHREGVPLEALIDPISVLNRGNWGQVYESIAGAVVSREEQGSQCDSRRTGDEWLAMFDQLYPNGDDRGLSILAAPDSPWFSGGRGGEFPAVVGHQFVMRMPQHAQDKSIADTNSIPGPIRVGKARIDLLSQFALWAHGVMPAYKDNVELSAAARTLEKKLWLAGVGLTLAHEPGDPRRGSDSICLRRLALNDLDSADSRATKVTLQLGKRGKALARQLSELEPGRCYYVQLPNIVPNNKTTRDLPWDQIAWIPIVSLKDLHRKVLAGGDGGANAATRSALARMLERLCKLAVRGKAAESEAFLTTLHDTIREAMRVSVGTNADNSKKSWMQEHVQGHRRPRSGRAVIAPSGLPSVGASGELQSLFAEQPLGIDEIGLPEFLYQAVSKNVPDETSGGQSDAPLVWIKRDPILHRWGFLPVNCRRHTDGATIRVPASLLGALGADFDGDEAAVIGVQSHERVRAHQCLPSRISIHDFFNVPMFKPGKQYIYGLHLLVNDDQNAELFRELQSELEKLGAPRLSHRAEALVSDVLDDWCKQAAVATGMNGKWWALVEKYALLALASDPGMGFGVFRDAAAIGRSTVVRCKAAKAEFYGQADQVQSQVTQAILSGTSLGLFAQGIDPIGNIMAAAPRLKQKFGNEVRHIVLKGTQADPATIGAAQALTEKLTQSVLSVKSVGKPLPKFEDYERFIRACWLDVGHSTASSEDENASKKPEWVRDFLDTSGMAELLAIIAKNSSVTSGWQTWLFAPYDLVSKLAAEKDGIELPVGDCRVSRFLKPALAGKALELFERLGVSGDLSGSL